MISLRIFYAEVRNLWTWFNTVKPRFTDTRVIRTVCVVPGERKPLTFSLNLIQTWYGHPVKTDTFYAPHPPPPSPRSVSVLHLTGFDRIFQEQSTFIESGFVPIRLFSTSTFGLGRYTFLICIIPLRLHISYTQPHPIVVYCYFFFFLYRQSKVMLLTFPLSFRMIYGELEQGKFATTWWGGRMLVNNNAGN